MNSFDRAGADVFFNLITENGFYVDVGVRDGIHDNKTFLLYKNGWLGIGIDAHPNYIDICKVARPNEVSLNVICGENNDNCKFRFNWRGSFSAIYNEELDKLRGKLVTGGSAGQCWYGELNDENDYLGFKNSVSHSKSLSLDTIIDTYNKDNTKINVLNIDVDGSEKIVLNNFDIKKYNPEYVCIEIEQHASNNKDNDFIINYMKDNNYIFLTNFHEDYVWCNNQETYEKGKLLLETYKKNKLEIQNIPTIHPCNYLYENNLKLTSENIKRRK